LAARNRTPGCRWSAVSDGIWVVGVESVEEIELAIQAHPTLSESIAEAVLDSLGRAIHI
jgi:hypothetical protein